MVKDTDILITGGYGTVGRRVSADLAPDYPGRVVVAGRSAEKAAQLAAELGHGVRGRRVDVGEPDSVEAALDGVGLVMSCIDQPQPHLLRAAIADGLAYTDIAPHPDDPPPHRDHEGRGGPNWRQDRARGRAGPRHLELARPPGSGPSRGRRECKEQRAALRRRHLRACVARIPSGGDRSALRGAHRGPRGARTAVSRLALEPPWLGTLLSALVRLRVAAMLRRRAGAKERVQRLNTRLHRRYQGHDSYGVIVEIHGARGWVRAGLAGREQATGTAIGAAAVVRSLVEGEVERAGIWLAEQVVPPGPFFERLAARGLVPTIEARLDDSPFVLEAEA